MSSKGIKLSLSGLLAAIGSAVKAVAAPFLVLCTLMCVDFFAGITRGWHRGELSSRTGVRGLVKKLCYGMAVIAAAGVDCVIAWGSELAGGSLGFHPMFVLLVIFWLSINECISILENLSEIGVPLPGFLLKAAKRLKSEVEKKGEDKDGRKK